MHIRLIVIIAIILIVILVIILIVIIAIILIVIIAIILIVIVAIILIVGRPQPSDKSTETGWGAALIQMDVIIAIVIIAIVMIAIVMIAIVILAIVTIAIVVIAIVVIAIVIIVKSTETGWGAALIHNVPTTRWLPQYFAPPDTPYAAQSLHDARVLKSTYPLNSIDKRTWNSEDHKYRAGGVTGFAAEMYICKGVTICIHISYI